MHNFSSISEEIIFIVKGNAGSIKLYLHAPVKYQQYIESIFYANFPTSDILILRKPLRIVEKRLTYAKFSKGAEFYDTSHFQQGGTYIDPFKDILSLYFGIPD